LKLRISLINYKINQDFIIDAGFIVNAHHIAEAASHTNIRLSELPSNLFRSLDFKTCSSILGALFCTALARETNAIVNPIEKGHPDILPRSAQAATESELRNYPSGLEIKCTVGNVRTGVNLRAGQQRIDSLTGITWQAHHREVKHLVGLVWDFVNEDQGFSFPAITGVFYSDDLNESDWGMISGTTGRNTKVSGMCSSGKRKMGSGWIVLIDHQSYLERYSNILNITNV
jgi:hypothetical protein